MDALADLDLDQIADPTARRFLQVLLNLVEEQQAELERLRAENQQLRDELARLQGGSGRPTPPSASGGCRLRGSRAARWPSW